jgi:hypothetical protein
MTHSNDAGGNILDYAIFPTAIAARVTLNVMTLSRQLSGAAAAPYWDHWALADHRPIVITFV